MNDYLNYNRYESNQFDDYEENDNDSKKGLNIKFIVIGFAIIVLIVIILIVYINSNTEVNYSTYENKLIAACEKYVEDNNIYTYKESYLDAQTLNVSLPNSCSLKSGVIYNNDGYKPYLLCDEYESPFVVNENNDIELIGNKVDFVMSGSEYYDKGFISNQEVKVSGVVGKEEGVYTLYYMPIGSGKVNTRKVIVTSSNALLQNFPYINLLGNALEAVKLGDEYHDSGATASDLSDGILTDNIVKYGTVDTQKIGEYIIYYSVTNKKGYTSTISRKVSVEDKKNDLYVVYELSTTEKTSDEVEITLNVIGDDYYYTVLPDGFDTIERLLSYSVNENGKYTFEIYNKNGNLLNYDINITNISKVKPKGVCTALIYSDRTEISVNASSGNNILGYNYYVNGVGTGYRTKNIFSTSVINPSSLYVNVLDSLGNEGKISCSYEDKRVYADPTGIKRSVSGTALNKPIQEALANRGYTVNDLNACIYNRVKNAGPGTRYGVMAAGVGLIECTKNMTGYVIPYGYHGGRVDDVYMKANSDLYGKLGINRRWGNPGDQKASGDALYGLDCATFVRWSLCNGGMNMCIPSPNTKEASLASSLSKEKYFAGGNAFWLNGDSVKFAFGEDLTKKYNADQLLSMIKPGDIIYNSTQGHIVLVIGTDSTGVYIAENGSKMKKYSFKGMKSGTYEYRILLLDNYYARSSNKNNLYN